MLAVVLLGDTGSFGMKDGFRIFRSLRIEEVWSKIIEKNELEVYKQKYKVLSSMMHLGKYKIHIYSETKPDDFALVSPDLKDAYFYHTVPFTLVLEEQANSWFVLEMYHLFVN